MWRVLIFFFLLIFSSWLPSSFDSQSRRLRLHWCCYVCTEERERGRYWSVYQFNPLSPLSLHYLFLAPSFCLLPYPNSPPHYQFLFLYPRLLFSLSLSLFFSFSPPFPYVSFQVCLPLRRWRRDAGQRDPALYQGRTKKKTKSFVVFFPPFWSGGGLISNRK